jgi:hypothetical protein
LRVGGDRGEGVRELDAERGIGQVADKDRRFGRVLREELDFDLPSLLRLEPLHQRFIRRDFRIGGRQAFGLCRKDALGRRDEANEHQAKGDQWGLHGGEVPVSDGQLV